MMDFFGWDQVIKMNNIDCANQRTCIAGISRTSIPDSKVHGANMGPIWGRQDPGGPHIDPMNLAIRNIINVVESYG